MNQMKNHERNNPSKIWILLIGSTAVTLYFNTQSMDPFNPPKLWVLILLSSVLVGDLLIKRNRIFGLFKQEKIYIILLFFILSLFLSTILTSQKYIAFFGDTQRKNGFIQYFCLAIIFIATTLNSSKNHYKKIYTTVLSLSLILSIYGFMQHSGKDFVAWNNPYNSVILTVGNPNFAAALMSLILIINFAAAIDKTLNVSIRIIHLLAFILLLIVIVFSNARQGLLAGVFGLAVFIIIITYRKYKLLGKFLGFIGILMSLVAIAGMLQRGPLASTLYKGSVSIRGYYWRAAVEMFKHHPIFGVGIDSYNLYFKQYREPQYSLNYGFEITSSNAHNTFLQFFATGGLFVGLAYLIFTISVLLIALKKLRNIRDTNFVFYTGILGAWVAYQAQSLISIDNIGISIWNWILSGFLVGLSLDRDTMVSNDTGKSINIAKQSVSVLISWSMFLISFFVIVILFKGENNYIKLRDGINPSVVENRPQISEQVDKVNSTFLIDPYYKFLSTNYLFQIGNSTKALEILQSSQKSNPRNLDYIQALAQYYERINSTTDVIFYRKRIYTLDPWNAENLLSLGLAYKSNSNEPEMKDCLNKILEFADKNPIAEKAKIELVLTKK
jgi:O-antigen ligase